MVCVLTLFTCIVASISLALASPGDNLYEFQKCCYACEIQRNCHENILDYYDTDGNEYLDYEFTPTPWLLRSVFLWNCVADCDYQCQQVITHERIESGDDILQFHGKWPFIRVFTMQEFYATIFSIGNFVPQFLAFKKIRKAMIDFERPLSRSLKSLGPSTIAGPNRLLQNYLIISMVGMAAWISSTIFHWRDLLITERLDYFFAGMTVLSGFHAIFARLARLDKIPKLHNIFSGIMVTVFLSHLIRLYFNWSYRYNMRFNVSLGILQYVLLLTVSYQNFRQLSSARKYLVNTNPRGQKSRKFTSLRALRRQQLYQFVAVPIILVLCTALPMCLELYDFFNYNWQIDAHAIWHACTIWPSYAIFDFLLSDFHHIIKTAADD